MVDSGLILLFMILFFFLIINLVRWLFWPLLIVMGIYLLYRYLFASKPKQTTYYEQEEYYQEQRQRERPQRGQVIDAEFEEREIDDEN